MPVLGDPPMLASISCRTGKILQSEKLTADWPYKLVECTFELH